MPITSAVKGASISMFVPDRETTLASRLRRSSGPTVGAMSITRCSGMGQDYREAQSGERASY